MLGHATITGTALHIHSVFFTVIRNLLYIRGTTCCSIEMASHCFNSSHAFIQSQYIVMVVPWVVAKYGIATAWLHILFVHKKLAPHWGDCHKQTSLLPKLHKRDKIYFVLFLFAQLNHSFIRHSSYSSLPAAHLCIKNWCPLKTKYHCWNQKKN
jgi:hypothetical protein